MIKWLRVEKGEIVADVPPPTLQTLVFSSNLVGLSRILCAGWVEPSAPVLAALYALCVGVGFVLGSVTTARFGDRAPRLCAFGLSFTALVLHAAPDAMLSLEPSATSTAIAIATMAAVALATAGVEWLHRVTRAVEVTA